jgi:N-acetylglucosaminyldiphosphoundecaprenol N-acetyl-beta-D-mannosaminyltransferase
MQGIAVPERVPGIDLMELTMDAAERLSLPVYFYGATPETLERFSEVVRERYPELIVAGSRNGYEQAEDAVVREAVEGDVRFLYLAMSSPMKELVVERLQKRLPHAVLIGVGGSFDVWAGVTKRAPRWMQRSGLEWFYRFVQEPRRMWRRYLVGNLEFAWIVLRKRQRDGL